MSTDRVLAQFCHSSVAVSLTGTLPEDRHFASQNTLYAPRFQRFGAGARRRSAPLAAPSTGHFETETSTGGRDTNGSAEAGKRCAESRVLVTAVCALRTPGEAATCRLPPSRTAERAIRAPSHRSPELWTPVGAGSTGSDLSGDDGSSAAIRPDHLQQRRRNARHVRYPAGWIPIQATGRIIPAYLLALPSSSEQTRSGTGRRWSIAPASIL